MFDGAAQHNTCGSGGLLISQEHNRTYHFWIDLGEGTNTRAKLLALWALLKPEKLRFYTDLFVYGDSRIIVDRLQENISYITFPISSGAKDQTLTSHNSNLPTNICVL